MPQTDYPSDRHELILQLFLNFNVGKFGSDIRY